ncbi:MAG: hypothetical protein IIA72_08670 [Proteobacteria bacterium]|nr:hypothetical protein [Pseudomonadota bacterium]
MASKKPSRPKGNAKYVGLGHGMVTSLAWRSLSGPAVKWYVELRDRFNGANNGDLHLSCGVAAKLLHMSTSTAWRVQGELVEKGLILRTKDGNWYLKKAATWALTDRAWRGNLPTHAYKHWSPPDA